MMGMIAMYCRGNHGQSGETLCPECIELRQYVVARLERCPFGDEKPPCDRCPIHCYKVDRREQIKAVMRYAGPRMLFRHPILAVRHFIDAHRKVPKGTDENRSV